MRGGFFFCRITLLVIMAGGMMMAGEVMTGCGGGKKKTADEGPTVNVDEIVKSFPVIKAPYVLKDSVLRKKSSDSLKLSAKDWKVVIGDSVYDAYFGNSSGLRLYALGRLMDKQKRSYLLVKAITADDRSAYLFYFDAHDKEKEAMVLATDDDNDRTHSYAKLDAHLNISLVTETKKAGGTVTVKESIYGLSEDGNLALIMTNSNEDASAKHIYNPIDTMSRREKWSGDYTAEPHNIVSIRDGVTSKEYRFFIHFISDDGTCKGEVKGEAEITGEHRAKFTERVGPCGIEFNFDDGHVTIKEVGGCGAFRGMNCFFEGTYTRQRSPKTKKKK